MTKFYSRLAQAIIIYACGIFLYGCNVINPKEPIPTYIHIDSVHLLPNAAVADAPRTSHITNVIVYYNNNPVGSFDLPCTIPVVTGAESGTGHLQISPGITINGLNNVLGTYAFYQVDTFSFPIQPGKVINHMSNTSFYNDVKITTISNFDNSVNFALWSGNIPMVKITDPAIVFQGFGTGSITLSAVGDSSIDSSTSAAFTIPVGEPAFIEFDYKSDVPFFVGLQANLSAISISSAPTFGAGIAPSDHWQKFYFNAADFAGRAQATSYNLYFKAVLGAGQTSGRLLIDNVQLVTF